MFTFGKDFTRVTHFVKKLRGGSQPVLVRASDGHLYVAKFMNNLQGRFLPFNESMGSELYRAIDLPVPDWKPLLITRRFIDRNPPSWMQTQNGFLRPDPGLCFGSRFIGAETHRVWEILPGAYFQRISNANDFWAAKLLDLSANHADNRQAIFVEHADKALRAVFVDHGHMFGGAGGDRIVTPAACSYLDKRIYQLLTKNYAMRLKSIAANLDADRLWNRARSLPLDWKSERALGSLAICLDRLSKSWYVDGVIEMMMGRYPCMAKIRFGEMDWRHRTTTVMYAF